MDARTQEQIARNEDVFRQINERVDLAALSHGRDGHRYEFFCECDDLSCVERISLTLKEYEHARADPTRFVVLDGHEAAADVEHVVEDERDHLFVEKTGIAGRVATELNGQADQPGG